MECLQVIIIFEYTTNSAISPCQEIAYPVVVTVLECACGEVSFPGVDPLCNSNSQLELSTIINTNEPGAWSVLTSPTGNNPATLTGTLFDVINADTGEYVLQYQLTNSQPTNCPDVFTQSIFVNQPASAGSSNTPFTVCAGESVIANLADLILGEDVGGTWTETSINASQGNAFDATNGSFNTEGQISGTYIFQYDVSDGSFCPTQPVEVIVEINETPIANAGSEVELTCNNPISSLNASGSSFGDSFDISWSGVGVLIDSFENTLTPTISEGGIYELVITNIVTGCWAVDVVEVFESADIPIALAGVDQEITCNVSTVVLQPEQGYGSDYLIEWSGPGITDSIMNDLNPEVNTPGTYTLIVTLLTNGCSSSPDSIVVLNNTDEPDIMVNTPLSSLDCNTTAVDLIGSSFDNDVIFEWTDSAGNIIDTDGVLIGVGEEGIYYLTVTNTLTGCSATEMLEVVNNTNYPIANAGPQQHLDCNNTIVVLDGTASQIGSDIIHTWTGPGINGSSNSPIAEVSAPGIYTLEVLDISNGCISKSTVSVEQDMALPLVTISTPEELDCQVSEVTLNGNGSTNSGNGNYQWLNEFDDAIGIQQELVVGQAGLYYFIVTDLSNGCMNSATVEVMQNEDMPQTALLDIEMPLCAGENNAYITISEVLGGTDPYTFSFNGSSFTNNNFYTNLAAGIYSLILEDANGCQLDTTIQIVDPLKVDINIGPDIELEIGDSIQINAQVNLPPYLIERIIWSPANIIHCGNESCTNIGFKTLDAMTVSATIVDVNGCSDMDQLSLIVDRNRKVFIPSAFSPNGDDINELFQIYADDERVNQVSYFRIFNRWGEEVFAANAFSPNDPQYGWDGQFRGEDMNPGVFVYIAEIEFIDGHVELYQGDVTLIR